MAAPQPVQDRKPLDPAVARLLAIGTYASVALLAIGLAAMLLNGISPYDTAPTLELGGLLPDLLAGRPEAFLWLGLIVAIATPTARVMLAVVGYVRNAEWEMAGISAAILAVITLSVILARLAEA